VDPAASKVCIKALQHQKLSPFDIDFHERNVLFRAEPYCDVSPFGPNLFVVRAWSLAQVVEASVTAGRWHEADESARFCEREVERLNVCYFVGENGPRQAAELVSRRFEGKNSPTRRHRAGGHHRIKSSIGTDVDKDISGDKLGKLAHQVVMIESIPHDVAPIHETVETQQQPSIARASHGYGSQASAHDIDQPRLATMSRNVLEIRDRKTRHPRSETILCRLAHASTSLADRGRAR
jgi:hypothetical protein